MMTRILVYLIRFYRYTLSYWVGQHCRFYPSCSAYTQSALEHYGCMKGGYLAAKRLLKCHPWHEGGEDPLPMKDQ